MSSVNNDGSLRNQVNFPTINGNLIIHPNGEQYARRLSSKQPAIAAGDPFVGREPELSGMAKTLGSGTTTVLVNGLGGVGKTSLATKFYQEAAQHYNHLCWVEQKIVEDGTAPSDTPELATFAVALVSDRVLVKNLGLEDSKGEADLIAEYMLNALANLQAGKDRPNLLVIDNAGPDLDQWRDKLPKAPDWHVLITSRNKLNTGKLLEIESLPKPKARELFYKHYQLEKDDQLVDGLLDDIECHTLTLELIAKTAQHCSIKLPELIETYSEKGLALGRTAEIDVAHDKDGRYQKLFPYLSRTFQLANLKEDERRLLGRLLLFGTEAVTPRFFYKLLTGKKDGRQQPSLFSKLGRFFSKKKAEEDFDQINNTFHRLHKAGWLLDVKTKAEDELPDDLRGGFRLHRIIRGVVEKELEKERNQAEVIEMINSLGRWLLVDQNDKTKSRKDRLPYLPLAEGVASAIAEEKLGNKAVINLYDRIATLLEYQGSYKRARQYGQAALDAVKNNQVAQARLQSNLAIIERKLGNYSKAAKLHKEALQAYIMHYNEQHPFVQIGRSNLAKTYQDLNQPEEAAKLLEKALQAGIAHFGEQHPQVQALRSNLALVYQDLSCPEKATKLLDKALQADIEHFGEQHPKVQIRRSNLALVYQDLNRSEEAAELLKKALQANIKHFGEQHPSVQISRSNLAVVYKDLDRLEAAAELLEKALKAGIEHFGEQHPSVATRKNNLAANYYQQERYKEAEKLMAAAYATRKEMLGEDHPHTQTSKEWLATIREKLEEDATS